MWPQEWQLEICRTRTFSRFLGASKAHVALVVIKKLARKVQQSNAFSFVRQEQGYVVVRARAKAAVLGAFVADGASMALHRYVSPQPSLFILFSPGPFPSSSLYILHMSCCVQGGFVVCLPFSLKLSFTYLLGWSAHQLLLPLLLHFLFFCSFSCFFFPSLPSPSQYSSLSSHPLSSPSSLFCLVLQRITSLA